MVYVIILPLLYLLIFHIACFYYNSTASVSFMGFGLLSNFIFRYDATTWCQRSNAIRDFDPAKKRSIKPSENIDKILYRNLLLFEWQTLILLRNSCGVRIDGIRRVCFMSLFLNYHFWYRLGMKINELYYLNKWDNSCQNFRKNVQLLDEARSVSQLSYGNYEWIRNYWKSEKKNNESLTVYSVDYNDIKTGWTYFRQWDNFANRRGA